MSQTNITPLTSTFQQSNLKAHFISAIWCNNCYKVGTFRVISFVEAGTLIADLL